MSYEELAEAAIVQGEAMITANSKESGLQHEARLHELLHKIRELEHQAGFPFTESESGALARMRDWEEKHGAQEERA